MIPEKWVYGASALLYFVFAAVAFVFLAFDGVCGFLPASYYDPRSGGTAEEPGYGVPVLTSIANISVSLLLGFMFLAESLGIAISAWWMYEKYTQQAEDRLVWPRWIVWSFSQALGFVILAYVSGATNAVVIASVAMASIGLNWSQSVNEALYCGPSRVSSQQSGKCDGETRIEGYLLATLFFLYIAGVDITYLATATGPIALGVWIFPAIGLGLYLIFHLLIIGFTIVEDPWVSYREYFFLIFQFLFLLNVAIATYVNRAADCIV